MRPTTGGRALACLPLQLEDFDILEDPSPCHLPVIEMHSIVVLDMSLVEHHIILFNPNGSKGDVVEEMPNFKPIREFRPNAIQKHVLPVEVNILVTLAPLSSILMNLAQFQARLP